MCSYSAATCWNLSCAKDSVSRLGLKPGAPGGGRAGGALPKPGTKLAMLGGRVAPKPGRLGKLGMPRPGRPGGVSPAGSCPNGNPGKDMFGGTPTPGTPGTPGDMFGMFKGRMPSTPGTPVGTPPGTPGTGGTPGSTEGEAPGVGTRMPAAIAAASSSGLNPFGSTSPGARFRPMAPPHYLEVETCHQSMPVQNQHA